VAAVGLTPVLQHLREKERERVRWWAAKLIERCSDGVEDQGAEDVLWGRRSQESTESVLERAVSRERLFVSASRVSLDRSNGTISLYLHAHSGGRERQAHA
jgi:hypothetical protein